jgi:hypothetical protein
LQKDINRTFAKRTVNIQNKPVERANTQKKRRIPQYIEQKEKKSIAVIQVQKIQNKAYQ